MFNLWFKIDDCMSKSPHNRSQRQFIKLLSWFDPIVEQGRCCVRFHLSEAKHAIPFKKSSRKTDDVARRPRAVKKQQILRCMRHLQFGNSRKTMDALLIPPKLRSRYDVWQTYFTSYIAWIRSSINFLMNPVPSFAVRQEGKFAETIFLIDLDFYSIVPTLCEMCIRLTNTNYRQSILEHCPLIFHKNDRAHWPWPFWRQISRC